MKKTSKVKTIKCSVCGKKFKRRIYVYQNKENKSPICSTECQHKLSSIKNRTGRYGFCERCGKEYYAPIAGDKKYKKRFCSRKCFLPNLGIKHKTKDGYVYYGKRSLEHISIIEKIIGRKLKRGEHIHHINGDKTDNKLDNLQLLSAEEHSRIHNGWIKTDDRWFKPCFVCKEFKELNNNNWYFNKKTGRSYNPCKECNSKYVMGRIRKRNEEKKKKN